MLRNDQSSFDRRQHSMLHRYMSKISQYAISQQANNNNNIYSCVLNPRLQQLFVIHVYNLHTEDIRACTTLHFGYPVLCPLVLLLPNMFELSGFPIFRF